MAGGTKQEFSPNEEEVDVFLHHLCATITLGTASKKKSNVIK